MAKMKANLLQRLDWTDKACLVVNRVTKSMELSVADIEKTVGLPLFASFPNEYLDVTRAAREGNPSPKLAGAAREFAEKLLKKKFEEKRARFIERFAVVPARYSFK
jgi:Flp pilus assembly CpaE family ATPase